MFVSILISSSIVAFFLLIWFRSDAYLEYCRLFKLDFISFYKDYEEKRKNDISLSYHEYLQQYHNSFFTRLITCPVCTAVWLALFNAILFSKLSVLPLTFIGGLIFFGIIHKLLG